MGEKHGKTSYGGHERLVKDESLMSFSSDLSLETSKITLADYLAHSSLNCYNNGCFIWLRKSDCYVLGMRDIYNIYILLTFPLSCFLSVAIKVAMIRWVKKKH